MNDKRDYTDRLKAVIEHMHKCSAKWRETVPVHEVSKGQTVWQGDVEVYDLSGHPEAKRCYGWAYGEPEEFIVILELPPVTDAQSAVKAGIEYQIQNARPE